MKKDIHPELKALKITCRACDKNYEFMFAKGNINIDVCSNCHPFYTKTAMNTRALGRADRFRMKYAKAEEKK